MNKWRITFIDVSTGEVYVEGQECTGLPALQEPYSGQSGRVGVVVKVEKVLEPYDYNIYEQYVH